jgi:hypothetical protein
MAMLTPKRRDSWNYKAHFYRSEESYFQFGLRAKCSCHIGVVQGHDKPWFLRKFVPEFEAKLMSFGFYLTDPKRHILAIDISFPQHLIFCLNVHSVNLPNV